MSRCLVYINLFPTEGSNPGMELAERYVGELRIAAIRSENGKYHLEATTLWEDGGQRTSEGRMERPLCRNESDWGYVQGRLDMPAWPGTWAVKGQKRLTADDQSHYIALELRGIGSHDVGCRDKLLRSGSVLSSKELLPSDVRLATGGPLVSPTDDPVRVMLARLVDAIGEEAIPGHQSQVCRLASEARKWLASANDAPKTESQHV